MAWQQSDLDAIRTNIASGTLLTRFADGREVRYQSLDMLIAAERVIASALKIQEAAASGAVRRRYARYTGGF